MKRIMAVIAVLIIMVSPAWACPEKDIGTVTSGGAGGAGGSSSSVSSATGVGVGIGVGIGIGGGAEVNSSNTNNNSNSNSNYSKNKNTNNNKNVNKNDNKNTNKNTNNVSNKVNNSNKQDQKQKQDQSQKQSTNNEQVISPSQTIITEQPLVSAPAVTPQDVPMLQGGKFGDVTGAMPEFFGLKPLARGEKIVKVIKVLNGGWFTKIRLEDVPVALMEGIPEGANVRYSIWVKDGASSVTTGGGIAGSLAGAQGAGTGAILPGWASSNADPVFVIFVYIVK